MYGLYDTDGILRYVNADIGACLAYAELFELTSTNYSLLSLLEEEEISNNINLDQNQAKNSN